MRQIKISNYISMTLIMCIVLVMFQFTGVSKSFLSSENFNQYAKNTKWNQSNILQIDSLKNKDTNHIAIIDYDETYTSEWCYYYKQNYYLYSSLSQIDVHQTSTIIINPRLLSFPNDIEKLEELTQNNVHIIFTELPSIEIIQEYSLLKKILGIKEIVDENYHLESMHIFDDFLLGGETIYEDNQEMTVSIDIPYVTLLPSYKVYMSGIIDDEDIDNEKMPALIWKSYYNQGHIYVINFPISDSIIGLGFLSALIYETQDDMIYPIVNANTTTLINYPLLTKENNDVVTKRYGQDSLSLSRDVLWPGIVANVKAIQTNITTMLAPRLDYSQTSEIDEDLLDFYMRQIEGESGEMGLSLSQVSDIDISEQIQMNLKLLKKNYSQYQLKTISATDLTDEQIQSVVESKAFKDLRTVLVNRNDNGYLLGQFYDDVLKIKVTWDGFDYQMVDDLRLKSLFTVLGMNNTYLDMRCIYYPTSIEDDWKDLSKKWSKYGVTYMKPFQVFDDVQLSLQDQRIRRFLALEYETYRSDNIIQVNLKNFDEEAFFILRTHNNDILSITNGTYQKIADGSYLIHAQSEQFQVELKERESNE